jgi:glycyl-tRNA synthetase alpha chain
LTAGRRSIRGCRTLRAEREYSAFNFEHADTAMLMRHFSDAGKNCAALLHQRLALPAYNQCIRTSHLFNLLDARGVISVAELASCIARMRAPAKRCCEAWVAVETIALARAEAVVLP